MKIPISEGKVHIYIYTPYLRIVGIQNTVAVSHGDSFIETPLSLVGGAISIAEYSNSMHHPVLPFAMVRFYKYIFQVELMMN